MVSSAIFLPKSTLLTDKLLNLKLFRSVNMTLDPEKNPNVALTAIMKELKSF